MCFMGIAKHVRIFMKHLKFLFLGLLAICISSTFTSCKDKDDEPSSENLASVIIGVWAQDGDNDILVINKNGIGNGYESPEDYYNKDSYGTLTWEIKNDYVYLDLGYYGSIQKEKLRAISVSKNEIKWYRYDTDSDGNFSNEYEEWIWTRYE